MKDKCTKYEGLFIFTDKEKFLAHIEECPDCKAEHEKMQRVSELIKEVAPSIKRERTNKARLKLACASFALIICVSTLGVLNFNQDINDIIRYGHTLTVEDYGFPVDSYGLIMVN